MLIIIIAIRYYIYTKFDLDINYQNIMFTALMIKTLISLVKIFFISLLFRYLKPEYPFIFYFISGFLSERFKFEDIVTMAILIFLICELKLLFFKEIFPYLISNINSSFFEELYFISEAFLIGYTLEMNNNNLPFDWPNIDSFNSASGTTGGGGGPGPGGNPNLPALLNPDDHFDWGSYCTNNVCDGYYCGTINMGYHDRDETMGPTPPHTILPLFIHTNHHKPVCDLAYYVYLGLSTNMNTGYHLTPQLVGLTQYISHFHKHYLDNIHVKQPMGSRGYGFHEYKKILLNYFKRTDNFSIQNIRSTPSFIERNIML